MQRNSLASNYDPSYDFPSEHSFQIGSMNISFSNCVAENWNILDIVVLISRLDWKNNAIQEIYRGTFL